MQKFYFVNHWFECWWEPYTDLCIVYWISIEEFNKILKKQQEIRLKDEEHWDYFKATLDEPTTIRKCLEFLPTPSPRLKAKKWNIMDILEELDKIEKD